MESRNGKRMMAAAGRFACSRFALNYTMFYEMMADLEYTVLQEENSALSAEREMAEGIKAAEREFLDLVGRFLKGEIVTDDVDAFRGRMVREAEKIMAYIDCFAVYEYVLKRLEGRFFDVELDGESDEYAVNQMMQFIFSAQETPERNQRIKMILAELPMRFTKNKFFSMARQALSVYEGTDRRSMEQVIANLEREALLTLPPNMEEGYGQLYRLLKQLEEADYKRLDKDEFSRLWDGYKEVQRILFSQSTGRMNLMELVNDFYVMNLTEQDMLMDSQEKEEVYSLISLLWKKMDQRDYSITDDELAEMLIPLEGRQESYYEQWSRFEGSDMDALLGEKASNQDREKARKVELLLSTSLYMSLEPEEWEDEGILLSRKAVEVLCQPFFDALESDWKGKAKWVVRSMMANLLSKLPMFFLTSDELQAFLYGCLSSCTDIAEKSASLVEIKRIMEMEDDLV